MDNKIYSVGQLISFLKTFNEETPIMASYVDVYGETHKRAILKDTIKRNGAIIEFNMTY